jgi:putative Holliday junction resolvase
LRILGLDYGDKTIGVAMSDPFGWTAQGIEIIRRKNESEYKKSLARLAELIEQYEVDTIVLGYPKNMDNSEGPRCEKTKVFQERLLQQFPNIPVILWDERMSTMAAERSLLEADLSRSKRKNVIDKMAAVYILQGYLDGRNK